MNHTSLALSARTHLLASVALAAISSPHAQAEDSPPKRRPTAYNDGYTGTLTDSRHGANTHSLTKQVYGDKPTTKNGLGLHVANHREPRRSIGLKRRGQHLALDD